MPATSNNDFPRLERVCQLNDSYCGPAVLQMLLSYLGIQIDQQQVVDTLNAGDRVMKHGLNINQMAEYIRLAHPHLQFWSKFNSTIPELASIINDYRYPVGVEWQGLFDYDSPEEEESDEDDDPGHFSVITHVDTGQNLIKIADPFRVYAGKDRKFSILQFERRWWDINEIIDPVTRHRREVDDYHALFIVTPRHLTFPEALHLSRH